MIAKNIKILLDKIAEHCSKIGRDFNELTLVAVSKNQNVQEIREAYDAGLKNFGENKAQELRDKVDLLPSDIIWNFIGHVQTNKVKYIVPSASLIHSVDSIRLLEEIENYAKKINKRQKILLEIKTSDEATKYGLQHEKDILASSEFCINSIHLELIGLMTMAPFVDEEKKIRDSFVQLRKLKEKLNAQGFSLVELSMGMSNDYLWAIEEGATILRIGTAIFGERIYN
ncbi:MAG: YggS family pyridoxal phosphate-dependent enzyme [Chlorobiaceae bacterium]|nr:YggS family pyridoxal phosphate-dependent enzyme [Chlorobiaceae bacterium]MBA4310473.1 YggS family pyridoxal phosphate-dependent enzyme [Chlorobiaceae bacterium]